MKALAKFFPFLLLFFFSLPTIKNLLKPGAYTSHDLTHHIVRIIQMDKLLKEGQIPPRWTGELNYGYGYPIFLFNYPLPHFFGALFHLIGFNFVWSAKLVFIFSLIFSLLSGYIFFKELWQDTWAGFLSSVFYLYAPIRFLNVYVSATIGNALAFAFIPLIFWAILKLEKKRQILTSILIGSLNLAFLALSHNILALMFMPVILIFILLIFLRKKETQFLKRVFYLLILGFGLASFFLLPALVEKKFIRYDAILKDFYKTYFPAFWQLIHSPWGYGFDHPETEHDAMSFQIGLAHIFVFILSVGSLLLFFSRKYLIKIKKNIRKNLSFLLFFLLFFLISIFLMLKVSIPIYEKIHYLQYVQHPWRFLALSVFCASALSGYLLKITPKKLKFIVFLGLLSLVLYANRNHLRINQVFDPGEDYYLQIKGTTSMAGEHLPEWARQMDQEAKSKIEVIGGEGEIKNINDNSSFIKAEIIIPQRAVLKINHFYFPGWQLFINGKAQNFSYLEKGQEKMGLPIFTLEKGHYHLKYILGRTKIRKIADAISLISCFIWLILGLLIIKRKLTNGKT